MKTELIDLQIETILDHIDDTREMNDMDIIDHFNIGQYFNLNDFIIDGKRYRNI